MSVKQDETATARVACAHLIRAKLHVLWVLLLLDDFLQAHGNGYPAPCRSPPCDRMGSLRW